MTPSVPACVQDARVAPCLALSCAADLGVSDARRLSGRLVVDAEQRAALALEDPGHAYGRWVLLAADRLEARVATRTRGVFCNPHDHGGAVGAVKVLQGRASQRVWAIEDLELVLVCEHTAGSGEPRLWS